MSVAVKAYLLKGEEKPEEIRRFAFTMKTPADFNSLKEKLFEVFPCLKTINVSWKDDEGDMISMSSDAELWLALKAVKDNLLRIFVREAPQASEKKTQEESNPQHPCVCDGCDKSVVGFRFKCLMCPDYDLCSDCEKTGLHSEHVMLRISPEMIGTEFTWWPYLSRAMRMFGGHHRGGGAGRGWGNWGRGCHGQRGWWGRHHEHGHQHPTEGAEAQGAQASAPKPDKPQDNQAPPPFNPKEMLESIMAAFGAVPQGSASSPNAGDNFLRRVGETVAAVLDPLGIDVEVDVKPCDKQQKPGANSEQKPKSPQTNDAQGVPPPEKAAKSAPTIDSETGDWTYVDTNERIPEGINREEQPKPSGPPISSLAEEMNKIDDAPLHPNPVIASALNQMLSMGFTNEGGWLTQLLEVKNGNMDSVLDVLHPVKPHSSH